MSKQTKAFLYNSLSFALFFIPVYFLVKYKTNLNGLWIPVTSFFVSLILAPKFQAVRAREGEKLFMSWIFLKGVREIK